MFMPQDREHVLTRAVAVAAADNRIVAGAVVGSASREIVDRWADLDLAFGVRETVPIRAVLDDVASRLSEEFGGIVLFDVQTGSAIFRVLLLDGCLQCDLSVMSSSDFGATGPKFRLLFGEAVEKPFVEPPVARDLFGYAVHHALRARFCIERGRLWQAEYWISGVRDLALALACRSRDLPVRDARGVDDLPTEVTAALEGALVNSLDRAHLLSALRSALDGLLAEAREVQELATEVAPRLRELVADWSPD